MFNRYSQRPQRSLVYLSIAQERAIGCEYPIGDPWGGPAFGDKNKGGFFSNSYWSGGGIVNSVVSFVSDPISYTNDRLKELDKTVIQPIGNGLEKVGQAIASDPENFALMLAAAATQQWYIVAAMAMVISAGKGNDWDKVLTDGAIAGATSFVAVEGSNMLMESMKVTAQGATSYAIAGVEISKTAATTIANGVSYTASSSLAAAATGKSVGEAALRGAITSGVVSAVGAVDIMKDFSAAIDGVAAKGVGAAITNAISGAAGTMLSGIVSGKDMSTQAAMALVGGAVSGLTSAIKISGDFFSNNAAEALDLQYDDYGAMGNKTVAEYLTDKLGAVGAGFVTNTVTSILTSTFTKGDPSTFLAQQIMGGLTQFVKNSFDQKFKNQYVDPLSKYMSDAQNAAVAFNELANSQNALGAEITGNITSYNNRVAAVNDVMNQRAALAAQYNGYTSANATQAQVDATYSQIKALDAQIAAEVASINNFYQTGIIEKQNQYAEANVKTLEAQNTYNGYSAALGDAAVPLTKYLNDVAKDMSIQTAKTLDPDFNPEEYRTINGLSSSVDVGAHYISTGKDSGLYTNFESAQPRIDELQFKAMDKFAASMGYSGGAMSLPPSIYNDALDKMQSFYGNNISAWEKFTPASFTEQIKLPPTAIMPMWESEAGKLTVAKVIYDNGQEQLVNITTQLPTGQSAATGAQIMRGEANVVRGEDGNFYWTVPDGKSTVPIYDVSTGRMVDALIGPSFESTPEGATNIQYDGEGKILGYTSKDGVQNLTIQGLAENNPDDADVVVTASRYGTKLDEVDPMMQMYTYSAMPDGIAANFNAKGIVQASKDVVNYFQKDASEIDKLKIATIVKSGGSVLQDVGTVLQDLSVTIGLSKTGETGTLQSLGKQLENLASASTPEQYKKAMEDIKSMRDAAKGTDIVGVNAAIAAKYPELVGISVFGGEFFEEGVQFGIGKAAFVAGGALAATLGAPVAISAAVAGAFGYGTSMALDFAESYRGGKEDMYTRMYDIYKEKGYSDAQAAQMSEAAAVKKGVLDGMVTLVINGATPFDLNKVMFGGKANPAQEAVTNYFVDKVLTMAKVGVTEWVSGGVEGAIQGAIGEAIVYGVAPDKADWFKGIADSAMLESIIGAPVSMATYGAANSFEMAQKTFTLANDQFTTALESGNIHTIGELGAVMKQWGVPTTVAVDIVPDIVENNPTLFNAYSTPAELTNALTSAFGFDATQAADIANIKFNNQITTADEATTALLGAGLKNVTAADAVNSGTVGVTAADQANKINTYTDQQMVAQDELEAAAKQENYTYNQQELDKLIGRGVEADVIAKFISEVDPKAVTTAEAKDYFQRLGYSNATADEIAQFVKSVAEQQVQEEVSTYVDPRQVTRDEAVQFYKDLNYTPTEAEIQQFIKHGKDIQEAQVKSDLGGYVDPRMVDSEEAKKMLADMGLLMPLSDEAVAPIVGQYMESELAGKAKESLPVISANALYQNIGAPMQNVEQSDLDYIKKIVSGQIDQDLAYDANKDGKVDAADQTLLEESLAFQQNENIQETINPETGITAWIDKSTNKEVFQPIISGGQWAPTGIYSVLEQQKAQAAANAKAQAAQAQTAQQKNQFGQLMNMLFQAPDVQGQQVTVKTPDPSKINYIYDFSSIFATPAQASLMPSPYGAVNTVMPMQPQQKQQAANQPLFQLASGFAGGGIVGDSDMEVGGAGSVDDLINILKGNSG